MTPSAPPPAQPSSAVSDADRLAIAARLHVSMRRITGRVTDTEWMAENEEYALEIMRVAREHARRFGHPELALYADELAYAMAHREVEAPQTLFERVALAIRQKNGPADRAD
ncbi:hypothetical protein EC845_2599 [Comamonas sp. BIGb0124]|jgi:hypothetical protein|uniref:hypothetical protein n=1 Tax=Comamonas sp. BIGb0124 TaxID=2485130 RepID=UPI000F46B27D|nr:hypothetical protein [Comamonas sp. BIGb0124]ROR20730.1 hypothetical protein EC845_2599 [Comamonas sp. BIGb0124]